MPPKPGNAFAQQKEIERRASQSQQQQSRDLSHETTRSTRIVAAIPHTDPQEEASGAGAQELPDTPRTTMAMFEEAYSTTPEDRQEFAQEHTGTLSRKEARKQKKKPEAERKSSTEQHQQPPKHSSSMPEPLFSEKQSGLDFLKSTFSKGKKVFAKKTPEPAAQPSANLQQNDPTLLYAPSGHPTLISHHPSVTSMAGVVVDPVSPHLRDLYNYHASADTKSEGEGVQEDVITSSSSSSSPIVSLRRRRRAASAGNLALAAPAPVPSPSRSPSRVAPSAHLEGQLALLRAELGRVEAVWGQRVAGLEREVRESRWEVEVLRGGGAGFLAGAGPAAGAAGVGGPFFPGAGVGVGSALFAPPPHVPLPPGEGAWGAGPGWGGAGGGGRRRGRGRRRPRRERRREGEEEEEEEDDGGEVLWRRPLGGRVGEIGGRWFGEEVERR